MRTRLLLGAALLLTAAIIATSYVLLANTGSPGHASRGATASTAATSPIPASDSNQHGYVALVDDGALFVQWTEHDHQLQGQLQQFIAGDAARTFNASFTGSHVDSSISLVVAGGFGASLTITGTLKGDTLTLVIPQGDGSLSTTELHLGTVSEFNARVRLLRHAASDSEATATTIAHRAAEATVNAADDETAVAQSAEATATAEIATTEQRTCAAVLGHLVPGDFFGRAYKRCAANAPTPGCEVVDFNTDGTVSRDDLRINNDFYPGCFPAADTVPADVAR